MSPFVKDLGINVFSAIIKFILLVSILYIIVGISGYFTSDNDSGKQTIAIYILVGAILVFIISVIALNKIPQTASDKKRILISKLPVSTLNDANQEYNILEMISAKSDKSFEDAKYKLQEKATRLNADAVIGTTQNTESNVTGSVSSSFGSVGGTTKTSIIYHINGTAIKYKYASANIGSLKQNGKFLTYDGNTGIGVIMLNNNTKMNFKIDMWDDPEFLPAVGMSDINIYSDNGKIRVMSKNYRLDKFES